MPVPMEDLPDQYRGQVPEDDLPSDFVRTAAPRSGDKNYIKPGDVEARRKQGEANTAAEQKGQPSMQREYLGGRILKADNPGEAVLNALKGVGSEILGAGSDALQAGATARDEGFLKGLGHAGLAGLRGLASFTAPLVDASTDAAEGHKNLLEKIVSPQAADRVAGITQSIMDVGAPLALGGMGNLVKGGGIAEDLKPWAQSFRSKRAITNEAKAELASGAERTKAAVDATRKAADDKIASIESGKEAYKESIESIAEAGEASVPTASAIRQRFAKDAPLGMDVGTKFKETYHAERATEAGRFNELYKKALKGTDEIAGDDAPYRAALDEVLGEKGISRPLPTQAERVAGKAKTILEVTEESEEQLAKMKGDIARAKDPASKKYLVAALEEQLKSGVLGEPPTVSEMVKEVQRLKVGKRAAEQLKDDNLTRQYNKLIDGLEAGIPKDVMKGLDEVNGLYREEFVPYFGKKSVTRAIADGAPERVVEKIILPAKGSKQPVETIERAWELIKDPAQRENVRKAFVNKGVEEAFVDGAFDAGKFTGWWKKYSDPTGTGDKVLRTVFGKDFEQMHSVVRQLENAKAQPLSEVAAKLTKNYGKTADDAIKLVGGQAKTSIKNAETAQKVVQKQLEAKIAELTNTSIGKLEGKVQSIGTGILYSGAMRANWFTMAVGGLGVLSAKGAGKLLQSVQGRNLFKAMLRGTPGTTQASATARQIENYFKATRRDDGD